MLYGVRASILSACLSLAATAASNAAFAALNFFSVATNCSSAAGTSKLQQHIGRTRLLRVDAKQLDLVAAPPGVCRARKCSNTQRVIAGANPPNMVDALL